MDSIKVIETRSHSDMVSSKVNAIQIILTVFTIIATDTSFLILNGVSFISLLSAIPIAMSIFAISLLVCTFINYIYVKYNYDKILRRLKPINR